MRKSLLPLFLAVLALTGCVSMNQVMESWNGSNARDLMISWGRPTEIYDDGEGGSVLVYRYTDTYATPAHSATTTTANATGSDPSGINGWNVQSKTTYEPARVQSYTKYRAFWVNGDGVIYKWQWQGL